jgi:uncharacterized protein (DUF1778 family)
MPKHDVTVTSTDTAETRIEKPARDARIQVRLATSQATLIRRAAAVQERSLTDFVIASASIAAEQILADRRWFRLDEAAWDAFDAALERPAIVKPRLRTLLDADDIFSE